MMQDNKFLEQVVGQNRHAMEAFYKQFLPLLWPIARRYARDEADAKSILNEAMLKIFRGLPHFDFAHRSIEPWIKKITVHCGIDAVRGRFRRQDMFVLPLDFEIGSEVFFNDLSVEELLELMKKLPETQRIVLILSAVEGFSHAEIAVAVGISEAYSRWYLHQARQNFKKILVQHDPFMAPEWCVK